MREGTEKKMILKGSHTKHLRDMVVTRERQKIG